MRKCIRLTAMNAQHAIEQLRGAGWSDAKIARVVGCSQPTITRIRHGQSDPRESTARELQKLLTAQTLNPAPTQDAA